MPSQKTKQEQEQEQDFDFLPYWKKEEQCYEEIKIEGKDIYSHKKVSTTWPRDKPQEQIQYELWLQKVKDPNTGEYYPQRDKDSNTVKGTGPKYMVKKIIRIRTNDNEEWLYSHGRVTGFDALGDPVSRHCQGRGREFWMKTSFAYKKEFDQKTMAPKSIVIGPNLQETVYEMPFNENNLKELFSLRENDAVVFYVKDDRMVRDVTGIVSKTLELMTKPFEYLYNSDYISPQLKTELRQRAIDEGILPPSAQEGQKTQSTAPPKGTYG